MADPLLGVFGTFGLIDQVVRQAAEGVEEDEVNAESAGEDAGREIKGAAFL